MAILARNHRGFLDAIFAAAKCGARIVLLNTSFAGPQIREVAEREGTDLLVYDDEYSETLEGIDDPPRGRWRAWVDESEADAEDTLEALIAQGSTKPPPKPGQGPKIVILTSGTTGTPKGAPRGEPKSLSLIGGLLGKVPFRAREVTELGVPDVPRPRLRPHGPGHGARLDPGHSPPLRPRGHARQPRGEPRPRR